MSDQTTDDEGQTAEARGSLVDLVMQDLCALDTEVELEQAMILIDTVEARSVLEAHLGGIEKPPSASTVATTGEVQPVRTSEIVSLRVLDDATQVAFYTAANALAHVDRSADSLRWPYCGDPEIAGDEIVDDVRKLAAFVRASRSAPPEALWRYAHGQCIHGEAVDNFYAAERRHVLPYRVFSRLLPAIDDEMAELAAYEAARVAAAAPPAIAGPDSVRGTVMEQHGSMLDRTFEG